MGEEGVKREGESEENGEKELNKRNLKKEGGYEGEKPEECEGVEGDNKTKLSLFYIVCVCDVLGPKRLKKYCSGSGPDSTGSGLFSM